MKHFDLTLQEVCELVKLYYSKWNGRKVMPIILHDLPARDSPNGNTRKRVYPHHHYHVLQISIHYSSRSEPNSRESESFIAIMLSHAFQRRQWHSARRRRSKFWNNSFTDPIYCPVSDFWLFPSLKQTLRGRKFKTNVEVVVTCRSFFNSLVPDEYWKTESLERWKKCIEAEGQYFETKPKNLPWNE